MKISVVIVNYNGIAFLRKCIESIQNHVDGEYEIIVVDNSSSDGSCDFLRLSYPEVRLIRLSQNMGFAAGNNAGVMNASGDYILLLNNDTELLSSVRGAARLMEDNPRIGVIGAKMLGKSGEYRYSAGYFPSPWRLVKISTMHIKKGFFRKGEFPHRREYYQVDWVEASFFLTRRSLWNILGGLDKNYFMYGEDVDYCRRVRDAGFMTVYCPSVQYLHYGGYGSTRLLDLVKGFIQYHRKFSGRWTRTLALLLLRTSICAKYWCSGVLLMAGKRAEYKMRREALSKVLSGNVWCG